MRTNFKNQSKKKKRKTLNVKMKNYSIKQVKERSTYADLKNFLDVHVHIRIIPFYP